jgi:hypothetical protein
MKTKTVKVYFTAKFEATMQVFENATKDDIFDQMSDIDIPENDACKYVSNTFEPVTEDDGHPVVEAP